MSKRKKIVAIVGRPNVGKSSLFNRLVGHRDAIVDDEAGITRDRHYGTCEWTGHVFSVIDTGGYMPTSNEMFDIAIKEQVEIAIHESDLLMFVVDVQSGVTDTDIQVANIIKTFGKEVILVANKVDNANLEHDVYPFYQLGLGEPVPVSAMIGRQSGDLLDVVVKSFEENFEEFEEEDDSIKVAVVGKENVGKSSYVNAIMGENRNIVTNVAGTTRDSNDSHFKYKSNDITIIDTAGLKRKARVKENVLFP